MAAPHSLVLVLAIAPALASAEGSFWCRWQPGTNLPQYGAFDAKGAQGTDVRVVMQGALLADADGLLPTFPALTAKALAQTTAPLFCQADATAPADGLLELTFSRRVSLGIEYTLGRCQLRYRCAAGGAATAPLPVLTECAAPTRAP